MKRLPEISREALWGAANDLKQGEEIVYATSEAENDLFIDRLEKAPGQNLSELVGCAAADIEQDEVRSQESNWMNAVSVAAVVLGLLKGGDAALPWVVMGAGGSFAATWMGEAARARLQDSRAFVRQLMDWGNSKQFSD